MKEVSKKLKELIRITDQSIENRKIYLLNDLKLFRSELDSHIVWLEENIREKSKLEGELDEESY